VTDPLLIPADQLGSGRVPVTILPDAPALTRHFADAILREYGAAKTAGAAVVPMIVPVGPVGQYDLLAERCNGEGIALHDLLLIGMDEYLTPDGDWIAEDDPLSFRGHMQRHLWDKLDPALAPPPERRVFPHPGRLDEIPRLIAAHGGVRVCFGGVGIAGHLAFNEPPEPGDKLNAAEFIGRPTRVVRLARETRTINAVTVWGGAIARIPERAVTVGLWEILRAAKLVLYLNRPWQRAVLRQALFGPVTPACPASFIQRHPNPAVVVTEEAARPPQPGLA